MRSGGVTGSASIILMVILINLFRQFFKQVTCLALVDEVNSDTAFLDRIHLSTRMEMIKFSPLTLQEFCFSTTIFPSV